MKVKIEVKIVTTKKHEKTCREALLHLIKREVKGKQFRNGFNFCNEIGVIKTIKIIK